MQNQSTVSIIVRTKDRVNLLKRALFSIAQQTYRPIEVILVNDGGCDLPLPEIKKILRDVKLKYIRLENNEGRAKAANHGTNAASGRYIAFLDDDDRLYSSCISLLVKALTTNDVDLVYGRCDCYKYSKGGKEHLLTLGRPFDIKELFYRNFIPINAMLIKREVVEDTDGFDPDFEIFEDWDFIFRVALKNKISFLEETVAEYSVFDNATVTFKGGHEYHKQYWDLFYRKHSYFLSSDVVEYLVERKSREKEAELGKKIEQLEREIGDIHRSRAWKVIGLYRKVKRICGF